MKKLFNLFNLLLTGLVFWIGNEYFNEYISIINTKTLIISALLMFGISYLFRYLMLASVLTIPICIGCLTTIILFFVAIVLTPIKLYLLDKYLPGFCINGFWTYVVLSGVLSIFSFSTKTENKNNNKKEE